MIGLETFAINLQAKLPKGCLEIADRYQIQLERAISAGLYRCPLESLHVSAFPIIWARGNYDTDPHNIWSETAEPIKRMLDEMLAKHPTFKLTGRSIELSSAAVILRYYDSAELEDIRKTVSAVVSAFGLDVHAPSIVHTTLFRFRDPLDLSAVRSMAAKLPLPAISFEVDQLILEEERIYPSIGSSLIAEYRLSS